MSTESIFSNLLQEEKRRLESNSQQKNKFLAAVAYIEKLEAENRELREIRDQFMADTKSPPDMRHLARIGFEAFWSERQDQEKPKWDTEGDDFMPWLTAAIAIRARCHKGAAAITRLEEVAKTEEVMLITIPNRDNHYQKVRLSINGIYGKESFDIYEAIESGLGMMDAWRTECPECEG